VRGSLEAKYKSFDNDDSSFFDPQTLACGSSIFIEFGAKVQGDKYSIEIHSRLALRL
jgi:hypothetical protein